MGKNPLGSILARKDSVRFIGKSTFVIIVAASIFLSGFFVANINATLAPAPAPCDVVGTPFVTIKQNISNDPDSGNFGNWAVDAFTENVTVWMGTDGTTYCANANTTNGNFVTNGTFSPEHGNTLPQTISGTFTGGENYTIPASTPLNPEYNPSLPQIITLPDSSTAGFSWWVNQVFPNIAASSGSDYVNTYSLTYVTPNNGTWTDADSISGGDVGDIGPVVDTHTGTGYSTIQAAINAATSGDTINVAAGTYNENQILINKPLTIQGAGIDSSIIDGGDAALTTDGLVRITANGNVKFDGFTIRNAGGTSISGDKDGCGVGSDCGDNQINIGIVSSGPLGATYTISNNKIIGTTNANDEEDYGLYANSENGGEESVIFTHNQITQTGANPILIEKHPGPTEVSYNNLDEGAYGSVVYFSMTYGGIDISTLQKVNNNTINLGSGNHVWSASDNYIGGGIVFRSSFKSASLGLGDGKYSNIEITGNTITNILGYRRGVALSNDAAGDGSAGEISNFVITGNTVTGTNATESVGIKLTGLMSNGNIQNNKLSNLEKGLTWDGLTTLVAENNWWGNVSGPNDLISTDGSTPETNAGTGSPAVGAVDYLNWCVNDSCTTPPVSPATAPDLGLAGDYAIFANTGIHTDAGASTITGNIGVGPGYTSTAITGFALNLPAGNAFSTSPQVTGGNVYAYDYAAPTPTNVNTASLNMGTAYTNAANQPAGVGPFLNRGAGTLTDLTLAPGVYTWGTAVTIPTDLILSGDANAVWIFQITGTLDMAAAKTVHVTGGAVPQNIFWQVSGAVNIGANTHFEGNILGMTSITLGHLASINGRLLAQTAVNLDANTVMVPTSTPPPAPSLTSADITSDGSWIGDLTGATLLTNNSGSCNGSNSGTVACHVLNVSNVVVNNPSLPAQEYGFTLEPQQATTLTDYFAAKGWPQNYLNQINSEISGSAPFFYFVSDGNGNYSLADGFQKGLGNPVNQPLIIDDNYPAGTYTFTGTVAGISKTVTLTVTKKVTPTLSVTNSPVTYNSSPQSATVVGSVVGTVSNVEYDGSATVPTNAGTYAVTADFVPIDTTNYNSLTGASAGNFTITPSDATITVTHYSLTYDGAPHTASVIASGVGSDADLSSSVNVSGTTHTSAGTFNGDAWTFANANYNSQGGTVDDAIAKADASITINGYSHTYDGAPHGASIGSARGVGGADLSSSVSLGSSFTNVPGGSAHWTFSNANYNDQSGDATITINKATPTATLAVNNSPITYDAGAHSATVGITASSVAGAVSNILTGGAATQTNANTYAVTANFVPTDTTNYNILPSLSAGNFVINKKALTVTANDATKNYGDTMVFAGTEFTHSALVGSDAVTSVTLSSDGAASAAAVGIYDIVPTAPVGTGLGNYTIGYVNGQLTIKNAIISTSTPSVVISSSSWATSTISVPEDVNNATMNVSALTVNGATSNVATLLGAISANTTTSIGNVDIEMPAGMQITGPSSWTGIINLPQVQLNSSVTPTPEPGMTASVSSVVEIGFNDIELTFNQGVRILLGGHAGSYVGYSRGGVFTQITNVCANDSQATGDALAAESECKIDVGSNLVIWTKHFTSFVTYTQTPTPAVLGGGGGGGGGYSPATYPLVALTSPIVQTPTTAAPVGQVLAAATFNFGSDLKFGMRSDAITELQNRLTSEGVYSGPITGYFGPLTLAGVKAYQNRHGVSQTGFVGPLTRGQLNAGQVAGMSTINIAAIQAQILSLQAQVSALLQQLKTLQSQ